MEIDNTKEDMRISGKGRRLRLEATIQEVKKRQTPTRDDIVRYIMNQWILSRRIAEIYVDELIEMGRLKVVVTTEGKTIEAVKDE